MGPQAIAPVLHIDCYTAPIATKLCMLLSTVALTLKAMTLDPHTIELVVM